MKDLREKKLKATSEKIKTDTLFAYGVYQIEADGKELFEYIKGDENSIMGLPIENNKTIFKKLQKMKKKYAIIGNPIEHSLSPTLHNYWFKKYNIDCEYEMVKIENEI